MPCVRCYFCNKISSAAKHLVDGGYCPTLNASERKHAGVIQPKRVTRGEEREEEEEEVETSAARLQCHMLAHHFCMSNDATTRQPGRFVRSIAAQIAMSPVLRAARNVMYGRDVERALLSIDAMLIQTARWKMES